ncbi:hypothetical protein [Catellatospora citrea]|uniref:Uncharacterized protein n=1 Tax=Catellatospora citrea TaxID=53366 RepID=A0A8J3K533_9ACTN|nr:hypothetical protein [Catellatospora citrea]RKE05528.1 hypothetical protein C8E86_0330 [Catellatospora citrea]GIF96876.1 hypothetical protein Cci01nite_19700 [Catellatospora citrea]
MQLFAFVVAAPTEGTTTLSAEVLLDILYAHALPADRLEHVRVRAGPGRFDVTLFLAAADPVSSAASADAIFGRALRASPLLCDWFVIPVHF